VFLSLQPSDIATQLNIWNFELFRNIQPVEYVNNVLTKDAELFPNLDLFIKRFEVVSSFFLLMVSHCSFLHFYDLPSCIPSTGEFLGGNRDLYGERSAKESDYFGVIYQNGQALS
jgi:hypothetical protein